jgi:hypothetical protein
VSNSESEWPRREHVELDGVRYEITVSKQQNDYAAEWECGACGACGGPVLGNTSAKQASQRAQNNLFAHHTLQHRA